MTSTMHTIPAPTLGRIVRHAGIAGQYALSTTVTYPGEDASVVTFTSNVYGGPIVLTLSSGMQTFIHRDVTDRIGSELSPEWVRRFFAPRDTY